MRQTIRYKTMFIHLNYDNGIEYVRVQDEQNEIYCVRSLQAAKVLITKMLKDRGGVA